MSARVADGWRPLLRTPHPCDHLIQLYTDEDFLARAVAEFVGGGLGSGEAGVIVATPPHVELFKGALATQVDVASMVARQQLVFVDAESCLARFMAGGMPDRTAFFAVIDEMLHPVRDAGRGRVRVFGEMVDLLWNDNPPATVALEALWNEVLNDPRLCLLCAYRIDNFDCHAHRGVLHQVSRSHSHLIPAEDYDRLDHAVDRAYRDVFGPGGDPGSLRALLVARHSARTIMPPAQAALEVLRGLNDTLADAVLERARHHYAASPTGDGPHE
jgi:hypothetical protein